MVICSSISEEAYLGTVSAYIPIQYWLAESPCKMVQNIGHGWTGRDRNEVNPLDYKTTSADKYKKLSRLYYN